MTKGPPQKSRLRKIFTVCFGFVYFLIGKLIDHVNQKSVGICPQVEMCLEEVCVSQTSGCTHNDLLPREELFFSPA